MALAASTASAGQTITLAAGSTTGHILVSHTGCTVEGAGIDSTTVVLDGTYSEGTRPGASVATFTLKNLTIDANALAGVSAPIEIGGGIASMVLENVRVLDHARGSIAIYNRGSLLATNIEIKGNGGGIHHYTGATRTTVRGGSIVGGQYGFVNLAADGIDLADLTVRMNYWAVPRYEAVTVTSYDATGAIVVSHVQADRSSGDIMRHLRPVTTFHTENGLRAALVRVFDRVEMSDGKWTQVLGADPNGWAILDDWRGASSWRPTSAPSGTATVYRVVIGRLVTQTATRLDFQTGGTIPASPRWRHVDGSTAPTPDMRPGSRLDIIRHGAIDNRDTDSGAIHVTEHARNARLVRCKATGGASDTISLRGIGTVAEKCSTDYGQDMGFTVDGTNGRVTLIGCQARRTGRTGFHLTGGPSDLYSCWAGGNGTINDGSGDYGVTTTSDCAGSTLQVRGADNLDGLLGGTVTEVTSGGFEESASSIASKRAPAFIYKQVYR